MSTRQQPAKGTSATPARSAPARQEQEPLSLRRDLDRFFEDLVRPGLSLRRLLSDIPHLPLGEWEQGTPALDVYEEKDAVVVKAELPGMDKEHVEVSVGPDTVSIRGEKTREEKVEEQDYVRSERSFGSIRRTVRLPAEVQGDKATATFRNGLLELRMPKSDAAKKRTVSVKVE